MLLAGYGSKGEAAGRVLRRAFEFHFLVAFPIFLASTSCSSLSSGLPSYFVWSSDLSWLEILAHDLVELASDRPQHLVCLIRFDRFYAVTKW